MGVAAAAGRRAPRARRPARRPTLSSRALAGALAVTVLSEVCFTLYAHAYDPFNVLGHVYLLVAFWLVFDALFVGARRPARTASSSRSAATSRTS